MKKFEFRLYFGWRLLKVQLTVIQSRKLIIASGSGFPEWKCFNFGYNLDEVGSEGPN